MNLVGAIGFRTVYSWQELVSFTGLKRTHLASLERNGVLMKSGKGFYPFSQKNVNEFLTSMNNGRIQIGLRGRDAPCQKETGKFSKGSSQSGKTALSNTSTDLVLQKT